MAQSSVFKGLRWMWIMWIMWKKRVGSVRENCRKEAKIAENGDSCGCGKKKIVKIKNYPHQNVQVIHVLIVDNVDKSV